MTKDEIVENLVSIAEQVDAILVATTLLSITIVVTKLVGRYQRGKGAGKRSARNPATLSIEWLQAHINLDYAWLVMLVLTTVHFYVSFLLLRSIASIIDCNDAALADSAWVALTTEAGKLRVFYELKPRFPIVMFGFAITQAGISGMLRDPIMLVHLVIAGLFLAAIVRFRQASARLRCVTLSLGVGLLVANWSVGSQWVLAASDIYHVSKKEPVLMAGLNEWVLDVSEKSCTLTK